jgi:hypothetical protein
MSKRSASARGGVHQKVVGGVLPDGHTLVKPMIGAAAFVERLRELGWIKGRNMAIEYRWGEGRAERFAEIAAEFVRQQTWIWIFGLLKTGDPRA